MKVVRKADVLFAQGPVELLTVEWQSGRNTLDLEVSSEIWDAKQQAWSLDILVTYDGAWSATSDADWITLGNTEPGRLTIMTTTNDTGSIREGTVTITPVEGDAVEVKVTQAAETIKPFSIVPDTLSIPKAGGRVPFTLYCPGRWTGSCLNDWSYLQEVIPGTPDATYRYAGAGLGKASLCILADENTTGIDRSSYVTFRYGRHLLRLNYTQTGQEATISVSPTSWTVPSAATATQDITVTSDDTWSSASNQSWLTVADSADKVTLTAAENTTVNSRTATVTVTAASDSATATVAVTQPGAAATVSVAAPTVTATEGAAINQDVAVTSNTTWSAVSDQSWLTVTPGEGKITLTADAIAPGAAQRTATVTVTTTAGSPVATATVAVTQTAAEITLSVDPAAITPAKEAGSTDVTVTTNATAWTAALTAAADWCTPTQGTGKVSIAVTENTGAERTATVRVTAGDKTADITVTQAAGA